MLEKIQREVENLFQKYNKTLSDPGLCAWFSVYTKCMLLQLKAQALFILVLMKFGKSVL